MLPNHRFRKTLILIGGSSDLGRAVTKRFAKVPLFAWNVVNIDSVENPDARTNFLIDKSSPNALNRDVLTQL